MDTFRIKVAKAKAYKAFVTAANRQGMLLGQSTPSLEVLQTWDNEVSEKYDYFLSVATELYEMYAQAHDSESIQELEAELKQAEVRYGKITGLTADAIDKINDRDASTISCSWLNDYVEDTGRESKIDQPVSEGRPNYVTLDNITLTPELDSIRPTPSQVLPRDPVVLSTPHQPNSVAMETQRHHQIDQPGLYNTSRSSTNLHQSFDPARLLTRVPIPKFSGDKKNYESWKAAFVACVDGTDTTPEYKLLRLRDSLTGEALRVIDGLGHSATAYEVAKDRLERKYGGKRRMITLRLEELDRFRPIRDGNHRDLEKFAELLDVLVVNLVDAGQDSELGSGSLYIAVQKKLSEQLLAKYNRWIVESGQVPSVETLRHFINEESEYMTIASETIHGMKDATPRRKDNPSKAFLASANPRTCSICKGDHGVWTCETFKAMDNNMRWEKAKTLKLCFRCLGNNHRGTDCRRVRMCGINGCSASHHRLLHRESIDQRQQRTDPVHNTPSPQTSGRALEQQKTAESKKESAHVMSLVTNSKQPGFVSMRTVPVYLQNNGRRMKVNALLDDASTTTYVNSDIVAELGVQGKDENITINVIDNNQETLNTTSVRLEIVSMDDREHHLVDAYTTERVTGKMQVIDWNKERHRWSHLQQIEFPTVGPRPIIDILIGLDNSDLHCAIKEVRGQPGEPIARLTPLGWTCIYAPLKSTDRSTHLTYHIRNQESSDLDCLVRRFWEMEEPNSADRAKPDEKEAEKTAAETLSFTNSRYSIGIPWKSSKPDLPNNYEMALGRLQKTEKRLQKTSSVTIAYKEVIQKYLEKGYIRKVDTEEATPEQVWYLPHFPVVRSDRATTKCRIVFDASAKYKGISLNDAINQGPKLQNDLCHILHRFRRDRVAVICDVAEMYLQVELLPQDRPYHRFLWRDLDLSRKPDVYEFNRVVFGVNSSPFLAQYVAQHHARQMMQTHPLGARTVLENTYMDDSMDSVVDEEAGIQLYRQIADVWRTAGMYARKWLSNSTEVLQHIPPEDRATELNLVLEDTPSIKTLGILWNAKEDEFTFKGNPPEDHRITKRSFLRKVATLFDPLGFLAPFTIRARTILQEMWTTGIDWDDDVPTSIEKKVRNWFSELKKLDSVRIPRCLKAEPLATSTTLHTFVDASNIAYGSVVYVRHVYQSGNISCRLVATKSRVAPLKAVSIPRLELAGAVLGLRLALSVAEALEISPRDVTFWSDSMDVLYWIRGRSRQFKPFVANRVGEIQSFTDPSQWRYVPTKENPADTITRGANIDSLVSDSKWWNGPEYLHKEDACWPENKLADYCDAQSEVKKKYWTPEAENDCTTEQTLVTTNQVTPDKIDRLQPLRYSDWRKLVRTTALVQRFIDNCRNPPRQQRKGELSLEELQEAEIVWIKVAQEESFQDEMKALRRKKELPNGSKLLPLKPVVDETGVIRSSGRIQYADHLPYDTRCPIILPRKHHVTELLIKDFHEKAMHGGTNLVLANMSARYWLMSGREAIREWERKCAVCRRKKATPAVPIMAPLPDVRVKKSMRAFSESATDFGGPFLIKQGRGKVQQKRYLCLFTCLATRAVHLEVAYGLDTDSFLNAFYRMASRRGLPEVMWSDNGTNFVGGNNELKELVRQLDKDRIQKSAANRGVSWHFNPPLAPHFGGAHEIMIKAAKKAIYAILASADITEEEFHSAVVGAEGLINSRPLTYQSANPEDLIPLTPNHFLHGQIGGQFAPETVDTTAFNPKRRWRRVQELVRHFWHRWLQEWVPGLNARRKWQKERQNLKIGDVVVIVSADNPRARWPLGRVTATYPGRDGVVRVVDVRVGKGTLYRRSVAGLCLLERYDEN